MEGPTPTSPRGKSLGLDIVDSGSGPSDLDVVGVTAAEGSDVSLSSDDRPAARCPTFKEFGEQIKALTQENFQLKVRIYLHESKHCKKATIGSGKSI